MYTMFMITPGRLPTAAAPGPSSRPPGRRAAAAGSQSYIRV